MRAHDSAFTSACYHKAKCNAIKNSGCTLMSAPRHEHLDAQMDPHAHTCIEARVCLVQCWKPASAALSLKAVYCDRHTAFSLSLSPCSPSFTVFLSPSGLNGAVAHFHMLRGALSHPVASAALGLPQPELQLSVASAACF